MFGITDKRTRKVGGSQAFEQPERTRKGLIDRLHINVGFMELTDDAGHRVLVFIMPSRPIGQVVQNSKDGIAWWRIGDSLVPMPDEVRRRIYEEGPQISAQVRYLPALQFSNVSFFRLSPVPLDCQNYSISPTPINTNRTLLSCMTTTSSKKGDKAY